MHAQPKSRAAFSTMGCGELNLFEVTHLAQRFDIHQIELRSLDNQLDLPGYLDGLETKGISVQEHLINQDVQVICLNSSVVLAKGDTPEQREELVNFSRWAEKLNVPTIRVFIGGTVDQGYQPVMKASIKSLWKFWTEHKKNGGLKVDLALETHDAASKTDFFPELFKDLGESIPIIWDTHHTWRIGGEEPRDTWNRIKDHVCHFQIKDSVDQPSARHPFTYVLPGEGQVPITEILNIAKECSAAISLEWEKLWHPYLCPLAEAIEKSIEMDLFLNKKIN